ncbi:gamma-glutamylcyclotransferase [Brevibacillus agri]|uniref:gamma-glutamylcyclotransferase family protein n=1 Tax=Brevibacillus TaxID=55080 RepID=UPI002E233D99|nr:MULTISPECIES: gamma-glutamylcyclotransferase family protein [Brevibacillus]MED1643044.1 gamma-glutamylcyclotransferase [Brevibacillus agri]MED2011164.1 gamma-glutamylcyclotransferase [Brevibacillus borstelensis]MED1653650.1 gamma-glutamylcyclotransferase [Brevibacillus agri]MED1687301.1 gamma-glutamylcyclotransferase [Brevibacillus agri]MED1693874.1 gamma-glutamylcyclotransferase [Brevibacillus agri]
MKNRQLYAAYGSNLNIDQMKRRCPESFVIGSGLIEGYELEFRFFANIIKSPGHQVPVVIWSISERDLRTLDHYEGVANGLYYKETLKVKLEELEENGHFSEIDAMVYIMNTTVNRPIQAPSLPYYEIVRQGYLQNALEIRSLAVAAIKAGAQFDEDQIVAMGYE